MLIRNGTILTDNWILKHGDVRIQGRHIHEVLEHEEQSTTGSDRDSITQPWSADDEIVDARGLYVLPGLIDIHTHGCAGFDFCDGSRQGIDTMAAYLAQQGVTSFLGTTMALPGPELEEIVRLGGEAATSDEAGSDRSDPVRPQAREATADRRGGSTVPDIRASLRGIYMEGPFFNKGKKGAHVEQNIIGPDLELFDRLQEASGHTIRILAIAPELPGAMALIERLAPSMTISLAHTAAGYDDAIKAFDAGASQLTHIFNAMPGLHHREPGVIGAAMDAKAAAELICDGFHIHPAVVRAVFRMFGPERVILISDSMRACGLENGLYDLGGQQVRLTNGKATLADGTLAGSASSLLQCLRNAVAYGIRLPDAVRAAADKIGRAHV